MTVHGGRLSISILKERREWAERQLYKGSLPADGKHSIREFRSVVGLANVCLRLQKRPACDVTLEEDYGA